MSIVISKTNFSFIQETNHTYAHFINIKYGMRHIIKLMECSSLVLVRVFLFHMRCLLRGKKDYPVLGFMSANNLCKSTLHPAE